MNKSIKPALLSYYCSYEVLAKLFMKKLEESSNCDEIMGCLMLLGKLMETLDNEFH